MTTEPGLFLSDLHPPVTNISHRHVSTAKSKNPLKPKPEPGKRKDTDKIAW
jgi:hypothetical protein